MNVTYDYLVIGGGVIGASTAYFLKQQQPSAKIALIEQYSRFGLGNTSKSAALYRDLFGSAMSYQLASSSIEFYKTISNHVGFKPIGYWWMLSEAEYKQVKSSTFTLNQKSATFDFIDLDDINGSNPTFSINPRETPNFPAIFKILHGKNCGSLSAVKLARYYGTQFKELGGKILFNKRVVGFKLQNEARSNPPWKKNWITHVYDAAGTSIYAKKVISAVGAWTTGLLTPLGIAPGIYPKRRQLFALKLEEMSNFLNLFNFNTMISPAMILPAGGVYIKPVIQEKILIVGCAEQLGYPSILKDFPPAADIIYFQKVIKPVLDFYFPSLGKYSIMSSWAGYYSYYWPDSNPVIEQVTNLIWVGGTSGSGIMKADSIGRIAAAKAQGMDKIRLYDGTQIKISDLSLRQRKVEPENFVI